MLKQIYYITLLPLLFLVSCKKSFLEVSDKSTVARQDYVTDLKTTKEFLNGVYVLLSGDFYAGYHQIYPEIISDNVKPVTTYFNSLTPQYNYAMIASTYNMNELWKSGYKIARSCSFVIEKAEEFKAQSLELANDLKGQAYAIRALVHFVMVNVFAQSYNFQSGAGHPGIPYAKTHDWTQPLTRQSVAEVYNELAADLDQALQLLPPSPLNVPAGKGKSVINFKAAQAIRARVYLFKGDYAAAKNLAVSIGKNVPLMTGSDYPAKLFTHEETEALFQMAPAFPDGVNGSYYTYYQGRYFYNGEVTEFLATSDIAAILTSDPNDSRKSWISSGGPASDTIVKYPRSVVPGITPESGSYYQTILRSSEMFLIAAESFAKLGVEDSARYYLDAIRQRANPMADASTAGGTALLDSIYLERRKELAFEGLRMFDILRWKKEVQRNDVVDGAPQKLAYPNNFAIAPIPENDVKILGIPQNPGY